MEERLNIALTYYSRKDVQESILNFCKNRETIPRHKDIFGKRPDTLEYPQDLLNQIKKGFTSFHCSQELWINPLELSTDLNEKQLNSLRKGWDLILDIDSKYLDYSKIAAELIIQALKFHNIKNLGIKFSGGKGMHIIVPWKAFPSEIAGKKTKDMFPDWPRVITSYLTEIIKPKLIEKITELTIKQDYVKDFEASKKVIPDLVLVSSRHLFRAPYSLHEKGLVSAVIDKEELKNFQPKLAEPFRVKIKNFYPQAKNEEARELLISALDWFKSKKKEERKTKEYEEIKIDKSRIIYPPSILKILEGLSDGRKRALFILINYFKSLGLDFSEVEKKIREWNLKNNPPLKENYLFSQLSWHKNQKKVLPPNYDKYYQDIGITPTEEEEKYKNPVNYTVKKSRRR